MSLHLGLLRLRDQLEEQASSVPSLIPTLHSIESLSRETDPELLSESAYHLVQNLERGEGLPLAVQLCELIEHDASVPPSLQQRAQEHRRILEGRGSGWAQWRQDGQRLIFSQFTGLNLGCFLGMFAGGLAFRGLGRFVQSRLAASALVETERLGAAGMAPWLTPVGIRLTSGSAGFAGEVLGYSTTVRGFRYLLGDELDVPMPSLRQELLSAVLLLGPFRLARHFASHLAPGVAHLMRHRYPGESELVLTEVTWHLTQQLMCFGAIVSQLSEEDLGMRPHRPYDETVATGLFRLLQYNLAQGGVNRVMRPR